MCPRLALATVKVLRALTSENLIIGDLEAIMVFLTKLRTNLVRNYYKLYLLSIKILTKPSKNKTFKSWHALCNVICRYNYKIFIKEKL